MLFSPGTLPICYLETSAPIVFWTDSTVAGMIDFYPEWADICGESLRDAHRAEQAALSNCRLAIYSSDWAAQTAINNYRVDASKVKVVPFGANIESVRELDDIRRIVAQRPTDVCKLLFAGVEWHRKGGDIAVSIARSLNAMGLKTELTVLGCEVISRHVPDFVSPRGFVSKKTVKGQTLIDSLFAESHFLLLPTRADCVPVVIAEANSFGLPVVASDVGGISTVLRNGINGYAWQVAELATHACNAIFKSMESPSAYRELAMNSFGQYRNRLNWETAGRQVRELLDNIID